MTVGADVKSTPEAGNRPEPTPPGQRTVPRRRATKAAKGNTPAEAPVGELTRAERLTALLNTAPDNTDHGAVREYLHHLADAGLAVLLIAPDSKVPFDGRDARQRNADDRAAQEVAREAGRRDWATVKSPSGLHLASSDPDVLDGYLAQYESTFGTGSAVNMAVVAGPSGLVIADTDTASQTGAFLGDAGMGDAEPTVRSPGQRHAKGVMVHSDGGHFWFTVPDGVELPGGVSGFTDSEGEYAVMSGSKYVLIPPSTREEGPYTVSGPVRELPDWLRDRIIQHGAQRAQRATQARQRAVSDDDPITRWGAEVTWSEILEPTGWANTGKSDNCGCDIWTAPGSHASWKSATAHEAGCSVYASPDPPLHIWTDHDIEPFTEVAARYDNTVNRLRAYAAIHHGGDEGAAIAELDLEGLVTFEGKHKEAGAALATVSVKELVALPTDAVALADQMGLDAKLVENEATRRQVQLAGDRLARARLSDNDSENIALPEVMSLDDLLASEDDPVRFRIDRLWPADGAKVLCAAPAGAGKTTLSGNLVRSLADGVPFLGEFAVGQSAQRIVIIDNEMTQAMLRRWLRQQGVRNTSAVVDVVTLRGNMGAFDMGNDRLRGMWTRRLADLGCDVVLFDCVKPVLEEMRLDENREMGKFLYPFSEMLAAAGVQDVLVHHHMGHNAERPRGDSTALGWSDANWLMVLDAEHPLRPRYFSTTKVRGGEVVGQGLLTFDPANGHLTYAGGNRVQTKAQDNVEKRLMEVCNALADAHVEGVKELTATAVQKAAGGKKEVTTEALALGKERKLVLMRPEGRARLYRLNPDADDPLIFDLRAKREITL